MKNQFKAAALSLVMAVAPALTFSQQGNPVKKDPQKVETPDVLHHGGSISGNERPDDMTGNIDTLEGNGTAAPADSLRAGFSENADSTSGEPDKAEEYAKRKANLLANPVQQGTPFDAETASGGAKIIALHISGGLQNGGYAAEQYAIMLEAMFKDTDYVDHPTQIVVFWEETGKDRSTVMSVEINGRGLRDVNDHTKIAVFTPNLFVTSGTMKQVADRYYTETNTDLSYQPAPSQ
ncbi:hypothetical protein GC194_04830 [bacterium]|nr:hypothetical protein [bacterium]